MLNYLYLNLIEIRINPILFYTYNNKATNYIVKVELKFKRELKIKVEYN